jgi:hypothetical protein
MPEATHESTIGSEHRRTLVRLLRASYPHSDFPDGPYERTADAVAERVASDVYGRVGLIAGLESLNAKAGGSFVDLDDDAAYQLLVEIEDVPFFALIRSVAVVSLYNDHEVWDLLGYEGESFSKGGYIDRGFDDLDWLPTPRIEEYDGPDKLVEVAPADQPKGALT